MQIRKNHKTILYIIIITLISIAFYLPSLRSAIYLSINKEFAEKVGKYAISANVLIVQLIYKNQGDISSFSVSAGASGVIIHREGNKYYALTAEHVVRELADIDKTQIIAMGYDQLKYNDYLSSGGNYEGIEKYYRQFPEVKVEYANEKYDLAVISFYTNEDYAVLPISEESAKFGDTVASLSNPHGRRNVITVGKVRSIKPGPFGDKAGESQYPIIKHTAVISEGSSGSALLNENLEIVGINLGGGENIFRKFVYGMAMPSDRIREFLDEWKAFHSCHAVTVAQLNICLDISLDIDQIIQMQEQIYTN